MAGALRQQGGAGREGLEASGDRRGESGAGGDTAGHAKQAQRRGAGAPEWELDAHLEVPIAADGHWNAVAFWFTAHLGGGASLSSYAVPERGRVVESGTKAAADTAHGPHAEPAVLLATSWGQSVQYVDRIAVRRGSSVEVRVRQDSGQYIFTTTPQQCRPRHAMVPRWHFDMVLDSKRNDAYEAAIR